jgi:hypothetical protein
MPTITLELDRFDFLSIEKAVEERLSWIDEHGHVNMPPSASDQEGAAIAEICRGWMEFLHLGKPPRT